MIGAGIVTIFFSFFLSHCICFFSARFCLAYACFLEWFCALHHMVFSYFYDTIGDWRTFVFFESDWCFVLCSLPVTCFDFLHQHTTIARASYQIVIGKLQLESVLFNQDPVHRNTSAHTKNVAQNHLVIAVRTCQTYNGNY